MGLPDDGLIGILFWLVHVQSASCVLSDRRFTSGAADVLAHYNVTVSYHPANTPCRCVESSAAGTAVPTLAMRLEWAGPYCTCSELSAVLINKGKGADALWRRPWNRIPL